MGNSRKFTEFKSHFVRSKSRFHVDSESRFFLTLIQAERLAATGKIANRVAHELRNPLTIVGGFARRLNEKIPDDDPNKRYVEIILREVKILETKVSEIIRLEEDEE